MDIKHIYYKIKDKFLNIGKKWDNIYSLTEDNAVLFAERYINAEPELYKNGEYGFYSDEYCLAHSAESINERYRQDRADEIDLEIYETLKNYHTDTDLIVYRGVCGYVFNLMKENAKNKKGVDLYEKAFMSTSLIKGKEINCKIRLRIYIPKDTNCVFMGNVNDELETYYEVAIQKGAALKIESIDNKYINCRLLYTS